MTAAKTSRTHITIEHAKPCEFSFVLMNALIGDRR